MKLYNLALQPSTSILRVIYGNFSSGKQQELILVKTKSIELYSISENGKMELITSQELFCVLRTVVSFRFHGTNKDLLIIGSDSGKVVILDYVAGQKRFVKTHQQTFGKSGCRRIVPGQHITVDPRGRAFMITAIQKQKFVYVLNRENDNINIHSPLEAHRSHTVCMDCVALDVGNQNAMFACLQIDYGQVDDKQALINTGAVKKSVAYYEMDFGMNTVIRKKEICVDQTAHMLVQVPGCNQGPGGILILLQDFLIYRGGKQQHVVRFPLRKIRPLNRKTQFTCSTTYRHKGFFFLIASELGDIFKVDFKLKENNKDLLSLKIQYFDTAAILTSMAITKNGYLFCAAQKQDHKLYAIVKHQAKKNPVYTHPQIQQIVQFEPYLQNHEIKISDTIQQYGPASDIKVADLNGDNNPQIYMLNASGSGKSYLRIIKQGLRVRELSSVKYQKGQDIWCLKISNQDQFDKLIIISFASKTIAFSLNEKSYSNATGTGIEENTKTLHMGRLEDDSLVQIQPHCFRHITKGHAKIMKVQGTILKGTTKGRQMVIALAGGDVIYYQLDESGELNQVQQVSLEEQVISMDLAPIQQYKVRSNFLILALRDMTVRIFQLSPQSCLKNLSIQNMKEHIQSIVVEEMEFGTEDDEQKYGKKLYIYTGLVNGMLIRTSIDTITGKLTDSLPKYLGSRPVKCMKMKIMGKPAILALSSRPWLIYTYGNKQQTTLLAFPYFDIAHPIRTPTSEHSIVGFCENMMKIIQLQSFGQIFHSDTVPLDYSGKKLLTFDNMLAILQSQKIPIKGTKQITEGVAQWKSQISIFNPKQKIVEKQKGKVQYKLNKILMSQNQVATAMTYIVLKDQTGKSYCFLIIACCQNLSYSPKLNYEKPCIKVYERIQNQFNHYHTTQIQQICLVLHAWEDKILAGVGCCLRAYQIGRKKILRKAEVKNLSSPVNTIKTSGKRIFLTQITDSFHMYKYKGKQQTFYDIADDILPRYITCTCLLDDHTIIGADKFQNIFISRVPRNAEEDFQNNPNTYKFQWQHGYLNGAPFKMEQICNYYTGQIVTGFQKASLAASGAQIVIYSTINGGIGALCPLQTRQDVDFFTHVEMYMRNLGPNLSGRNHLNYRSYYSPCKGVIDGDLCQVYTKLPYHEQAEISKHLDLTLHEIHKKLQQMRNRLI